MRRIGSSAGVTPANLSWALLQIAMAHARGAPETIGPSAEAVLAFLQRMPTLIPYTAWVLAAIGRAAEARQLLEKVSSNVRAFPWLIPAADAAVILDDATLAERFYEPLAQSNYHDRILWGPMASFCLGPTSRTLGDICRVLGRNEAAILHYDEAIAVCERAAAKPLLELCRKGLAAARAKAVAAPPARSVASPPAKARIPILRREGEIWTLEREGAPALRLKDGKGLHYLSRLLSTPEVDVHVLDLVGSDEGPSDGGAILDERAKNEYKARIEDLRDQLEEATRNTDAGRARRAQEEMDAIAGQLAAAMGLGGRDRRGASNVERARINVQRRLRDALDRIETEDPALGRYLRASVQTGTFCRFMPV
jgi:hypothetical protein